MRRSPSAPRWPGPELARELSAPLAWSKIALTDDLMETTVDNDGWAHEALIDYFPPDPERTLREPAR